MVDFRRNQRSPLLQALLSQQQGPRQSFGVWDSLGQVANQISPMLISALMQKQENAAEQAEQAKQQATQQAFIDSIVPNQATMGMQGPEDPKVEQSRAMIGALMNMEGMEKVGAQVGLQMAGIGQEPPEDKFFNTKAGIVAVNPRTRENELIRAAPEEQDKPIINIKGSQDKGYTIFENGIPVREIEGKGLDNPDFEIKGNQSDGYTIFQGDKVVKTVKGSGTAKETERDKKIRALVKSGIPEEGDFDTWTATDYVDGRIRATTSPNSRGEVVLTNTRTGQSKTSNARSPAAQAAMKNQPKPDPETGLPPAVSDVRKPFSEFTIAPNVDDAVVRESQQIITGIDAALSAADNLTSQDFDTGPGFGNVMQRVAAGGAAIFGKIIFADEQNAAQQLRTFNQAVIRGMANNPRVPVAEQERIREILPNPNTIATTPDIEKIHLSQTVQFLEQKRENEQASLEGRPPRQIPRRHVGVKDDPIPLTDEFRQLSDDELVKILPKGVWFIDPKTGEFVINE